MYSPWHPTLGGPHSQCWHTISEGLSPKFRGTPDFPTHLGTASPTNLPLASTPLAQAQAPPFQACPVPVQPVCTTTKGALKLHILAQPLLTLPKGSRTKPAGLPAPLLPPLPPSTSFLGLGPLPSSVGGNLGLTHTALTKTG